MKTINIYTDGGARGNPGPAAIGIFISDAEGNVILKEGKQIGKATNNVAEYSAVLFALNWIVNSYNFSEKEETYFQFFLDSSLVVNQLNGIFKIKDANLKNFVDKVKSLELKIPGKIIYHHISREKNKIADFLVNGSF